jgi:hypothetical protein
MDLNDGKGRFTSVPAPGKAARHASTKAQNHFQVTALEVTPRRDTPENLWSQLNQARTRLGVPAGNFPRVSTIRLDEVEISS